MEKDTQFKIRDLRNGDWYWIHRKVYKKYLPRIGIIGLALYNAYASYSGQEGIAYPSYKTLSKELGISCPTIGKYNKLLEKCGLIKIKNRQRSNGSNIIYLIKLFNKVK